LVVTEPEQLMRRTLDVFKYTVYNSKGQYNFAKSVVLRLDNTCCRT